MKTLLKFMCVAMMAIVLTSCSKNNPESVAKDFAEALYSGNGDKAASYCTDDTKGLVQMTMGMLSSKMEEVKKTKPEVKVISSEINEKEKTAKVKISVSNHFDFSNNKVASEAEEDDIDLKQVDGKWKVAVTK